MVLPGDVSTRHDSVLQILEIAKDPIYSVQYLTQLFAIHTDDEDRRDVASQPLCRFQVASQLRDRTGYPFPRIGASDHDDNSRGILRE